MPSSQRRITVRHNTIYNSRLPTFRINSPLAQAVLRSQQGVGIAPVPFSCLKSGRHNCLMRTRMNRRIHRACLALAFAGVALRPIAVCIATPPPPPAPASTNSALTEHLDRLRKNLPAGFTHVVESPFVVLGDEPPEVVRQRAIKTVKWAVDKLKQDYFKSDPEEIIDIWLFKDDASYRKHAKLLFDDTPTTPFGYYTARHRALVMNISTGGGTLVHEIVHPFMRANFSACPAWFNEGLASLYEQSAEKEGHICGLINWRYTGLEKAIRAGKLISFQQLTALSDDEFYGGENNPGYSQYYGQARYLCFYLQEKGLLVKYYREFTASAKQDPTGYNTLKRVLGEKDMEAFQKKWEKFILGLRSA